MDHTCYSNERERCYHLWIIEISECRNLNFEESIQEKRGLFIMLQRILGRNSSSSLVDEAARAATLAALKKKKKSRILRDFTVLVFDWKGTIEGLRQVF